MRRTGTLALLLVIWWCTMAESRAQRQNDLNQYPDCKYCGMHRHRFAHSRMVLHYEGGPSVGVCSIHCASTDYLRHPDDAPALIEVGDYQTKKLIDAQAAWWVIGGSKAGVMTNRAKWAFEARRDALAYIDRYGGRIADFDEAMKASYEDIYEDMRTLKRMQLEYERSRHAALKASR